MRVVTSRASDISIIRITLTVKDTIRLKAHVIDFHCMQHRELIVAPVTSRTKRLILFFSTEPSRTEYRFVPRFTGLHRRNMGGTRPMTTLATNAMGQLLQLEFLTVGGAK